MLKLHIIHVATKTKVVISKATFVKTCILHIAYCILRRDISHVISVSNELLIFMNKCTLNTFIYI